MIEAPNALTGRCLVTGVAGFVGSHLADSLVEAGCDVLGLDCYTDDYDRPLKDRNLHRLRQHPKFSFVEGNLLTADLDRLLMGTDYVFHQAGRAGVRGSWDARFSTYVESNILATQRLLEAVRDASLKGFVFASSSSVYGDARELPTAESALPRPVSPYGVTKLAAEQLCLIYAKSFHVPSICLRYFTVYGPRQRPDMAIHKLISAVLSGRDFELFGDGEQTRDFTYVADIVQANLRAAARAGDARGSVFNVGGGSRVTLNGVIRLLQRITGLPARVVHRPAQAGDARNTHADCSAARRVLGYRPEWTLEAGLNAQVRSLQEAKVA